MPQAPRRWHFELIGPVLRHPRRALPAVVSSTQALWLTPLVLLTVLALVQVLVACPCDRQWPPAPTSSCRRTSSI